MLKIEIKYHQHKDQDGNNVIVNCDSNVATYVAGSVDPTWIDITEDCEGIDSIEITERIAENGQKQREKGATTQLTIGFDAYALIMDWLMATPCSFLNSFDVRITDTDLNYEYKLYEIKPDNIEMCDDEGCKIVVPLREIDDLKSITDKISIHDDWQGWFGGGQKDFPCMQVFTHLTAMTKAFTIGALAVIAVLDYAFSLLNIDFGIDEIKNKAYGFGRFLPTPYIRDILENAMAKVGYTIETPFDIGGFGENDVYVYSNGYYHTNWSEDPTSPSLKFQFENRQIIMLSTFLDDICKLYNCVWQIVGTKLIITPVITIDDSEPIFEVNSDDVVSDCKTFSFDKGKAGGVYEYQKDATDGSSSQTINEYNDVVDFDGVTNNAMLNGMFEKNFKFASTSFWGDSFGEDIGEEISSFSKVVLVMLMLTLASISIQIGTAAPMANVASAAFFELAFLVLGIATALGVAGFAWINDLQSTSEFGVGGYYKYSIKIIGTGSIFIPRIIRTDPASPMNYKKPVIKLSSTININPKYNLTSTAWKDQWNGHGDFLEVYNYPLFFDSKYFGNLYDTLHEQTDNALFLKQSNERRTIILPLCEVLLEQTGVNSDENSLIGKVIEYKGYNYKVIATTIKYSDYSIKLELKKIN
jgi:hypothetical protein